MSARIEQALAVLHEIWIRRGAIAALRGKAVNEVADRIRRRPETVHAKLVRQLSPDVQTSADLDVMIARWLGGDPAVLHSALRNHTVKRDDQVAIQAFFEQHAPSH